MCPVLAYVLQLHAEDILPVCSSVSCVDVSQDLAVNEDSQDIQLQTQTTMETCRFDSRFSQYDCSQRGQALHRVNHYNQSLFIN